MELNGPVLATAPRGMWRLAIGDNLFAGGLVAVASFFLFQVPWFSPVDERTAWLVSAALGACAATRGTAPLDVLGRRYQIEGPTTPLLRASARVGDALSLFTFGLLFAIFHDRSADATLDLTPGLWVALALALGLVLGLLFQPFLGRDDSENARFLALVGIITFASGAGWFLDLSPLFITLVLGVVLVNTSKAGPRIQATLVRTERPMSLVLFLFAGALWTVPPIWQTLALFPTFVLLRFIGKWLSSRLAATGGLLRHDLYRGHLAHGDAAIAMIISFKLIFSGPAIDIVYTVILGSVVFHDLIAPRIARTLLVDSGEVRRELGV
jgi:hypothetical protein